MESILKNMDFSIKHWGSLPRRYPSTYPLMTADVLASKKYWVRYSFSTCNFSFILSGKGLYHRQGKAWPVVAPCVITQWPGENVEYGPTSDTGNSLASWDELYLIYDAECFGRFKRAGLVDVDRPVWSIPNFAAVELQIEELDRLARSKQPEEDADRMDRACERLILESYLSPPRQKHRETTAIQRIQEDLRSNLGKEINLDLLAETHGLSTATFRRRWAAVSTIPPAQYRLQHRLREACNLLVISSLPVKAIAHRVGFVDELYFSRRFKMATGMSPSTYRKTYAMVE